MRREPGRSESSLDCPPFSRVRSKGARGSKGAREGEGRGACHDGSMVEREAHHRPTAEIRGVIPGGKSPHLSRRPLRVMARPRAVHPKRPNGSQSAAPGGPVEPGQDDYGTSQHFGPLISHAAVRARPGQDRTSLCQEITRRIIAGLDAGRLSWVQPWGTEEERPRPPSGLPWASLGPPLGLPLAFRAPNCHGPPVMREGTAC